MAYLISHNLLPNYQGVV